MVRDGDFVGVAAPDEPTAEAALKHCEPNGPGREGDAGPTDATIYEDFKREPGDIQRRNESRRAATVRSRALWSSVRRETRGAGTRRPTSPTPRWSRARRWPSGTDDRLTVWTGTQRPFGVRGELSSAFRLPEDRIRVIVPDTGGGYGGKHTGEAAIEAARLAARPAKPVKLVWSREEEFTWAYFRPAGLIEAESRRP